MTGLIRSLFPLFYTLGIFTLFHHLLVQHAAYIVGRKRAWFRKYAILGDDLVIGHTRVAKEYKRLLALYGVDISVEKSLKSVNGVRF